LATESYLHAAEVLFPGAAERAEARVLGTGGYEIAAQVAAACAAPDDKSPP
jgi:hypothetical protein